MSGEDVAIGITVERADPGCADALALIDALSNTLTALTGASGRASFDPADVRGARACFAIARGPGGALGCGALRPLEAEGQGDVGEIKRMFARPGTAGVGSAVLRFLEAEAARLGYTTLRLETRLVNARAVAFYERRGYVRIANYGRYVGKPEAACFEKRLRAGAATA